MWGLMQRIIQLFLTVLLSVGFTLGQTSVTGNITYVSLENAYMDLGKKAGVQIGDSVRVERANALLGIAVVTQASGSSSAIKALDPEEIDWQIGDDVRALLKAAEGAEEVALVLADSSGQIQAPMKVFLDSSAYQQRRPSNMSLDPNRFAPSVSGYVSARYSDRGGDSSGVHISSSSIYGQFNVLDLGIQHLDASVYLRGSQSGTDNSFQTQLYSIMLSYSKPDRPLSYLLGRMYHPQFSTLGTLDGVGITWRTDRRILAITGGLETPAAGVETPVQRTKFGILDEEHFKWGTLLLGNVAELQAGELARNYLLLGSTAKLAGNLRLRAHGEFDLDMLDQSATRNTVSLTRFRASLNWRPWRSFITNFRYSYRENVIDLLDTSATEFNQAARHSLNTNLSWMSRSGMTLSGQASYRTDGSNKQIQIYGLTYHHRNFSTYDLSLNVGAMAMLSYISEGGRIYVSTGKQVLPWLDIDLYDEVFLYKILGDSSFRTRHLPEISLAAKVPGLQRLRLRTRFEQENGELLYRFSLSASRQF